ncbi:hypothetical protein QJQ45_013457 [Haematococcus lacustris]|nr:hypothetical protein QJQ45_000632 [Haematococcus lacustris]KAJ9519777.1 hypothetical protein QJQ45_013457 [Haematococcus lacustris]
MQLHRVPACGFEASTSGRGSFVAPRPAAAQRRLPTRVRVSAPENATVSQQRPSSGPGSLDYEGLYSTDVLPTAASGGVSEVMRSNSRGLLTCLPQDTLEDVIPKLSKVTGLPVLSAQGLVVGVISRKDIIRVRRSQGSLQDTVAQHMTTPALTISADASVLEAANLMRSRKIRRLPVVDESGYPLGILARAVKYLYDGDCAMCRSLKTVLERQDNGRGKIKFVNIADDSYDPNKNMGIEYEEAMETIHAIRPDGEVLYGTDALRAMFNEVGLGWAAHLSELPLFSKIVDLIYNFLSANRLSLGGAMDAIIAAKRMELSKKGVETCGDVDEECKVRPHQGPARLDTT